MRAFLWSTVRALLRLLLQGAVPVDGFQLPNAAASQPCPQERGPTSTGSAALRTHVK
jgi:hypothetical protein